MCGAIRVLRLRERSRVLLLLHRERLLTGSGIHLGTRTGLSLERCFPLPRSKLRLWAADAASALISTAGRTCVHDEIGALAFQLMCLHVKLAFPFSKNAFFLLKVTIILLLSAPPRGFVICHARCGRDGHRYRATVVTARCSTFRLERGFRLPCLGDSVEWRKRDVARR